jgi:uncharacterized coiled-coil DUF342 family protein
VTCEEYKKCIMCVEYLRTIDKLRKERELMRCQINTYRVDIERLRREAHARQVMIDELRKGYGY